MLTHELGRRDTLRILYGHSIIVLLCKQHGICDGHVSKSNEIKLLSKLEEYLFGVNLLHMPIILREVYMSYGNSWVNLDQFRFFYVCSNFSSFFVKKRDTQRSHHI
jgi:hypothetical protein